MNLPALRFTAPDGIQFPNWQIKKLGEVSDIKRGASPRPISSPKWFDDNSKVGWVRISDVTSSGRILKNTTQYLSENGISKSRLVPKGHIIMSICATIGKPVHTGFKVCIHDGFVVFKNLKIEDRYLFYYLNKIQKKWYQYGQPGTQINLNTKIVGNESIPLPSLPEQEKIANALTAVDDKITALKDKTAHYEAFKKGLMQQLFPQSKSATSRLSS